MSTLWTRHMHEKNILWEARKFIYEMEWAPFKGNPNFQGILDWILQILHYYCWKQHKNIEKSQITEQNFVLSLPFSLFTGTCASCRLPQWQGFLISWTQYSANFKRHKRSFVPYIVSFSGLNMVFSKLSQLDITAYIKTVFTATSIYVVISCLQL